VLAHREEPSLKSRFHYGWIVVGVTFCVLLVGAGVRSTPGILMVPFEDEFHWSRATISFAVAVSLGLYGVMGPFAAAFMERFGLRRTMVSALALLATGVALTTLMRESWQLVLLWGVVVGWAPASSPTCSAPWWRRAGSRPGAASSSACSPAARRPASSSSCRPSPA